MMNKRGQGLETGTIILIILGILVLVVLILGFTIGWSTILPWLSPNNVNTIVTQCEASCSTGDQYGFCAMDRTLKSPDLKDVQVGTPPAPLNKKEYTSNCEYFANTASFGKYGIKKCPGLCPAPEEPGE